MTLELTASFSHNRSFQIWKKAILSNLLLQSQLYPIYRQSLELVMATLCSTSDTLMLFRGSGHAYKHKWNNVESKYIAQIDGNVVAIDQFWARYYPFISEHSFCQYKLKLLDVNDHGSSANTNFPILVSTHNEHFGHFIADDLPWLSFYINELHASSFIHACHPLPRSIRIELNQIGLLSPKFDSNSHNIFSSTSTVASNSVTIGYVDGHLVKAYLLRKLIHKSRFYGISETSMRSKRIFVYRDKPYKSRIANLEQLKCKLSLAGFICISLDKLSLTDTKSVLEAASIIITESGSTSLVVSICAAESTILYTLQPDCMLSNPDRAMILSGLPYATCYHGNINIIPGSTVKFNPIQSSSIAHYDPDFILSLVRRTF